MHPTVDAYIGIWRFVSANKIDVTDKTGQVQAPSCSVNLGNTSRTRDMACLTESPGPGRGPRTGGKLFFQPASVPLTTAAR